MQNIEAICAPEAESKRRLVLITGVPGAGKDFLLGKLKDVDSRVGSAFSVFNFGGLIYERLKSQNSPIASRDQIRDVLTQDEVLTVINSLAMDIINQQPGIVVSHLAYKQRGSIQINPEMDKMFRFKYYIYIWSPPEEIFLRRLSSGRDRAVESVDDITIHQRIALGATRTISSVLGARLITVYNRTENVNENVAKIRSVIEKI